MRGSIKIDGLLENDMGMEIVETTIPSGKVVVSRCVCVCVWLFFVSHTAFGWQAWRIHCDTSRNFPLSERHSRKWQLLHQTSSANSLQRLSSLAVQTQTRRLKCDCYHSNLTILKLTGYFDRLFANNFPGFRFWDICDFQSLSHPNTRKNVS